MHTTLANRWVKIGGGGAVMIALLLIYAVVLGVATFVEHAYGTPVAMEGFYKAWWFFALEALLVGSFVLSAVRLKLWSRRKWAALLVHGAFVVVLLGALTTFVTGVEGIVHVRVGGQSSSVLDPKTRQEVAVLPWAVGLDAFALERYGHSGSPRSYRSDLVIEGEQIAVSMNNVHYRGAWRLYQTSYDPDEQGTYLTASRDAAGTAVTYVGYLLLVVGLVWSVCDKGGRFRRTLRRLTGTTIALLIGMSAAQADEVVDSFRRLAIQEPSGRVVSVDSYATDLLRKISRLKSYNGLSAPEVMLGLTTDPQRWAAEPLVMDNNGELVPFVSVIGSRGEYLLADAVERISRKNPRERSKSEKDTLKFDERINIVDQLLSGKMWAIFPTPNNPQQWVSPSDDLSAFSGQDSLLAAKIYPWLGQELVQGNRVRAQEVVAMIDTYQRARGGVALADSKIEAELLYNKLDVFKWCGFGGMTVGLLFLGVWIARSAADSRALRIAFGVLTGVAAAIFLFQTFGLGLRWYVSGRAPWTNAYESMVYVAWSAGLAGWVLRRASKAAWTLAVFLSGVLLFVSTLSWMDPQITPLAPVLDSYWLILHVAVITASYAFFALSFLVSVVNFGLMAFGRRVDAQIRELMEVNRASSMLGLVLLTIGIFLGAVWANESWGRYWGWDPKETWALVTMLVYAAMTHMDLLGGRWAGAWSGAVGSVVGLAAVLMTFFGVNYYLSGMHSYGSDSAPTGLWVVYVVYGLVGLLAWRAVRYNK